ncbi:PTS cellobiose transporter subunit IIC [Lactobacillus paragasseri]|uniref:PTS cellobiose transporter subunit IIC n=1 Tax=Lactobacillus paragasseri TaxID=2107999 RepID=UPI0028E59723|nr:PTS cellobiose transporter subunit IIC [Lactobacillus paragasseri]MDT9607261.1 PTS cellobiose transporter subunit IIC [Lactobacillus paragasseri]MDT9614975.1 PTS cellobiose transporter subunit IIC [Lactobacillus paragasseri]
MSDTAQPSFKDKMMKILGKFSGSRFVRAIMGAGYSIIAFSIIGSMFLVLTVLTQVITAKGFVDFYNNTFGRFNNIYTVIYNATMGIIAIYFAGSFAYNYADIYRKEENLLLDPLNAVFLTLMGLFITVPQLVWKGGNTVFVNILKKDNVIAGGYGVSGSGLTRIGATGIFTGLIVAWLTVQIYRLCIKHNWRIKMPASVPSGVANSFTALIPGFVIAVVIALIDVILIILGTDIFQLLFIPFSFVSNIANTWWGVLIIFFLIHFLWWFGIHGATIISSFYQAIVLSNMAANASGAHYVFAGEFSNAFVIMGGSGATLGMALWMAFASRSKQLRELGKLEAVPAVFNINEPLLFGLPIVYNVRLFIPFLLAPMTCSMVAYAAIATHLVPKIIVQQPWPIPVGLGGMMATASWQGAVLALVNAVVAFLIWYPFIKHYDNELLKKEQAGAEKA